MFGCVKLIEYWASAVNVVIFNPCVGPLPRIKISFPYDQYALILVTKISFTPMLPSGNENSEFLRDIIFLV